MKKENQMKTFQTVLHTVYDVNRSLIKVVVETRNRFDPVVEEGDCIELPNSSYIKVINTKSETEIFFSRFELDSFIKSFKGVAIQETPVQYTPKNTDLYPFSLVIGKSENLIYCWKVNLKTNSNELLFYMEEEQYYFLIDILFSCYNAFLVLAQNNQIANMQYYLSSKQNAVQAVSTTQETTSSFPPFNININKAPEAKEMEDLANSFTAASRDEETGTTEEVNDIVPQENKSVFEDILNTAKDGNPEELPEWLK
jgi:hypothetical protein